MVDVPGTADVEAWRRTVDARFDAVDEALRQLMAAVSGQTPEPAPPPTPTPAPGPAPAGRITRVGTRLHLDGARYKFAGMNWDQAVGCGLPGSQPTDAQADRYFAELNPRSMTRIWVMPGMLPKTAGGDYDWTRYDRLVKAAAKHGQFLCVTVLNGLADCTSRKATYEVPIAPDIADWTRRVVGRHKGNPAVAVVEPANEAPDIGAWCQAMAALIKSVDPGVLVGTGGGNSSNDPAKIAAFAAGKDIDLISYHDYYAPAGSRGPRMGVFADAARRAGKPWYMGERGFCCGNPAAGGGGDTKNYAENGRRLAREYDLYLAEETCAGYLYWDFKLVQPETSTANFANALWRAACDYRALV